MSILSVGFLYIALCFVTLIFRLSSVPPTDMKREEAPSIEENVKIVLSLTGGG